MAFGFWTFAGSEIYIAAPKPVTGGGGGGAGVPGGPGGGWTGRGKGWGRKKKEPDGITSGEASTAVSTGSETELIVTWTNPSVLVTLHVDGISNTSTLGYRLQLSEDSGATWLAGTNYDFALFRSSSAAGTPANGTTHIEITQGGGNEDVGLVVFLPFPGDALRQHAITQVKSQQETGGAQQAGYGAARTSSARQPNAARLYRSDDSAINSGARITAILLGPL